jgi:hypothetical protein
LQPVFKLTTEIGKVNARTLTWIVGMSDEFGTATILTAPLITRKNTGMSESKSCNAPEYSARPNRRTHRRLQAFDTTSERRLAGGIVFRRVLKIKRSGYCFVMSVRIEQLGYHWTNFHETLYFSIFRK